MVNIQLQMDRTYINHETYISDTDQHNRQHS